MFTVKCHETSIYIFAKRLSIISTWVGRVCITIWPTCFGLGATFPWPSTENVVVLLRYSWSGKRITLLSTVNCSGVKQILCLFRSPG